MGLDVLPSIPQAHQQIRLGDIQASEQKWMTAIEYYLRAIEDFKAVEMTLTDPSLISIIQAQIIQCEKAVQLCQLKEQADQAMKEQQAEYLLKLTRTYSASHLSSSTKSNRMLTRHNTVQIDRPVTFDWQDDLDSYSIMNSSKRTRILAKKIKKHDSQKIEELQTGYEALKIHLKAAFDDIERLKHENNQLRVEKGINTIEEQTEESKPFNNTDEDRSETELEATL